MSSTRQAVVEAGHFLKGLSDYDYERQKLREQADELNSRDENRPDGSKILATSLKLLTHIHACAASETLQRNGNAQMVFDIPSRGVICQLLEIVVLLGIQPYLSPGMGVHLHQRLRLQIPPSILERIGAEVHSNVAGHQLANTVKLLLDVIELPGKGIEPIMRDHVWPDLVYGLTELSYSPVRSSNGTRSQSCVPRLKKLLNEYA